MPLFPSPWLLSQGGQLPSTWCFLWSGLCLVCVSPASRGSPVLASAHSWSRGLSRVISVRMGAIVCNGVSKVNNQDRLPCQEDSQLHNPQKSRGMCEVDVKPSGCYEFVFWGRKECWVPGPGASFTERRRISTQEMYLRGRDRGQRVRDRHRRWRLREKGKGSRKREQGRLSQRPKDCLWIERRLT